jgi:hypothetical protein
MFCADPSEVVFSLTVQTGFSGFGSRRFDLTGVRFGSSLNPRLSLLGIEKVFAFTGNGRANMVRADRKFLPRFER